MGQSLKHQAWIVLAAVLVFFLNLGATALWDDDEPRNAQCAREMLARGDLIVPRFNQDLRADKPVLLYWLMFTAYETFGSTEFAARFWSAVLAVGTSLITYHLGRRLFRAEVGLWGGLIVATSLMFVVAGRAATPDSTLIFLTTLAMLLFVWLAEPTGVGDARGSWVGYALAYAAMGAAVLAKGPVGVVLPGAVLGVYAICRTRAAGPSDLQGQGWLAAIRSWLSPRLWLRAAWGLRPVTAVLVVAAVALPWYVAVYLRTDGQWLAGFLGKHNVQRFLSPMEGHRGPIVYYVVAIMAGFLPWSVLLPMALVDLVRQLRRGGPWPSGNQFVACWVAVYVGFFSLAATKLPSYVLPAYPALALITAATLVRWLDQELVVRPVWMHTAIAFVGLLGAGLLVGLPIAARSVLPGEQWLGLAGLVPLTGAALAMLFVARRQPRRVAVTLAVTAVALATTLFGLVSVRVSRHQNSVPLVEHMRRVCPDGFEVCSFHYTTPSLVYYSNQRVTPCADKHKVQEFFQHSRHPLLVTRADRLDELKDVLPADASVLVRQRRFLRRGEVVLVGRAEQTACHTQETMH